ncbi:lipid A deacylase LpxR family protein [Vibrio hannami]|uniref:lipid A deacylase LpxR family protein n=1 Tax=Vibrio hannami TaxID=2717094 RepID=UPI00240FB6E6|nr:lipid A deacylase LpxR family protein [Vibrio hannami]MDG3088388.1 lipid A deacylase LpxR family protein [Vibrio hannami]
MFSKSPKFPLLGFLSIFLSFNAGAFSTSVALIVDNDGIFGTDEDYTSGVVLDLSSDLSSEWLGAQRWRMQLGQKIWTPSNLDATTPQPNERPYAGLLYAQGSIINRTAIRLHEFGLMLGTTGPDSYADQGQKFIHGITDSTDPRGWDYQIDNQIVGSALYKGHYLVSVPSQKQEVSTLFRAEAGNFRSEVATGLIWRWGSNLSDSFGTITPSNEGSFSAAAMAKGSTSGTFFFSGIEGRYRFNDITIEGDTMRETYPINIQNLQATIVFGGVAYWNNMGINITVASKTKDYKEAASDIASNASFSAFMRF